MKTGKLILAFAIALSACNQKAKESSAVATDDAVSEASPKHLFLDVHNLEPGKITFEAVAAAHQKDLATQGKYDVSFLKYWVDEKEGKVYCLAESPDSASVFRTHKEAHGLTPDLVEQVTDGLHAAIMGGHNLYLDVHRLGAGNVTTAAVADAHTKDLAVQTKYDVNFIDYWVDVKSGTVVCLSEADNEKAIISTHKEAHGLIPAEVHLVKQGQ